MSLQAREELCQSIKERYRRSTKKKKKKILDEFTAATGYHRKHAIRVLARKEKEKHAVVRQRRPPRVYTPEVQKALVTLWEAANRICSKRQDENGARGAKRVRADQRKRTIPKSVRTSTSRRTG